MLFDRAHKYLGVVLLAVDFVMLALAFGVAYWIRVQYDSRPLLAEMENWEYFWSVVAILPIWIVVFASLGLYRSRVYLKHAAEFARVVWGCFLGILLVIGLEYVTSRLIFPARLVMVYVFFISIFLVFIAREIVQLIVRKVVYKRYGATRVVVVGDGEVATSFIERATADGSRLVKIVAFVGPKKYMPKGFDIKHYDNLDDIDVVLRKHRAQGIIQTGLHAGTHSSRQILNAAERAHVQYCFVPGEPEFYSRTNTIATFLQFPVVTVSQTPLFGVKATLKRIFDLAVVIIFAPIWVSVMAIILIIQKIVNPGPIFFRQARLGRHGDKIRVYKLRSMWQKYSGPDAIAIFKSMGRADLAEQYAKDRKIHDDPRIAGWWGKFIRRTSLDELPQLINVLKGEMSLVGPRPIIEDELSFYKARAPLLLSVVPGMTGLASVSGRSTLSFPERVNLELYYAGNWTFLLDLQILWRTVGVLVKRKGAE